VWEQLKLEGVGADAHALALLLKVMVLLADAPPDFVAKLSPEHTELATRGQQFRVQLPSYLEQQRALVVAHCLLPAALQPIVYGLANPPQKTCGWMGCASGHHDRNGNEQGRRRWVLCPCGGLCACARSASDGSDILDAGAYTWCLHMPPLLLLCVEHAHTHARTHTHAHTLTCTGART
jgi:hypothetical protein